MKTKVTELGKLANSEFASNSLEIIKAALCGVLSLAFGQGAIFGVIAPFSAAFVAAMPAKYLPTAAIGTVLSLFLFSPRGVSGFKIAAIFFVVLMRYLLAKMTARRIKAPLNALVAVSGALLTTIVRVQLVKYTPLDMALLGIEVVLTGCFAYFFTISSNFILNPRTSPVLSYVQLISAAMFYISALCSLTSITIFNVNIGVALGVVCLSLITVRWGITGASIGSIITAISFALCSPEFIEFAGILIIAGFLAGAVSPMGKLFQFSAFILVSSFCALLLGAPSFLIYREIDSFIAAAIFVIIPKKITAHFQLSGGSDGISSVLIQKNAEIKLKFACNTVRDLKAELCSIASRFEKIDYNNLGSIADSVSGTVCKGCSRALDCWDNLYNETADAFNNLTARLKAAGNIGEEDLPRLLSDRCCKPTAVITAVNNYYSAFLSRQSTKRHISESRRIVFEQFSSLADMLYELSEEIGQINGYDESAARQAGTAFKKIECEPLQVVCALDKNSRMVVEIYTDNVLKTSEEILCEAISNACDRIFELPEISFAGGQTRLAFYEKAHYGVDFSVQQICRGGNEVCGDKFEHFCDSSGYSYFMLSDGMGSGSRAAVDSTMTCSIMSKLLHAGFGIDAAMKLINSSMTVKSTDESLSTIDVARIDLYTGEVKLYKAGAAESLALLGGELFRHSSTTLPIGIIGGVECEEFDFCMKNGDTLLMMSDGATAARGDGFAVDLLKRRPQLSVKDLAASICREAKEENSGQGDDITVAAIRLNRE